MSQITVTADRQTFALQRVEQSSNLADDEKQVIHEGTILNANWTKPVADDPDTLVDDSNYTLVQFEEPLKGIHNWYVFNKHIVVRGSDAQARQEIVAAQVTTVPGGVKTRSEYDFHFKLKGFEGTYNMCAPIKAGYRNKWYEALHFNPSTKRYRVPESAGVVYGILKINNFLEMEMRPFLSRHYDCLITDVGFSFNSWYRDPDTNRRVGGASMSRHMSGDAVDMLVYIKGKKIAPLEINSVVEPLCDRKGKASATCFTHIDARGYRSRWSYGF